MRSVKKKISWLGLVITLIAFVSVSATLAYLVASSRTITNTFTVGNIEITLTESTGNTYKIIPGTTVEKDPTVTVKGGSDACWLFVKVEKTDGFDSYMTFEPDVGWTILEGAEGIYYRQVETSSDDTAFSVLKNDTVTIKDTVTEEQLAELDKNPSLQFTAHAIQIEGNETAQIAWQNISVEEE